MFICTVRAGTLKFIGVIVLAVCVLVALVVFIPSANVAASTAVTVDFTGAGSEEGRVAFLRQFGIEVEPEPVNVIAFTIPAELDRVLAGYNEIQKKQELDLSRYKKKKVTRYTYEVSGADADDAPLFASITVYRDRVIAADLTSTATGKVYGLNER